MFFRINYVPRYNGRAYAYVNAWYRNVSLAAIDSLLVRGSYRTGKRLLVKGDPGRDPGTGG